jgi:hypothetical protein
MSCLALEQYYTVKLELENFHLQLSLTLLLVRKFVNFILANYCIVFSKVLKKVTTYRTISSAEYSENKKLHFACFSLDYFSLEMSHFFGRNFKFP